MTKRFTLLDETIFDNEKQAEDGGRVTYWVISYGQRQRLVGLLNTLHQENNYLSAIRENQQQMILKLKEKNEQLKSENKKLQCINDQLEERLENSGIGIVLKMDCDKNE